MSFDQGLVLFCLLFWGLPALLVAVLAFLATRLRLLLDYDYSVWVLAGAIGWVLAYWVVMYRWGTALEPNLGEYDFLANLMRTPIGGVLGAGTVLLIPLLRRKERTAARNVLALLLPGLLPSALGLASEIRSSGWQWPMTATQAYWLGVYGLPVVWWAGCAWPGWASARRPADRQQEVAGHGTGRLDRGLHFSRRR